MLGRKNRAQRVAVWIGRVKGSSIKGRPQLSIGVHLVTHLSGLKFEFIGRCVAVARVKPIHEAGRLVPAHLRSRLVGSTVGFVDKEATQRVGLDDHLLGDFKLANAKGSAHRADGIWVTSYVRQIARIADRDKINVEPVGAAAERGARRRCRKSRSKRGPPKEWRTDESSSLVVLLPEVTQNNNNLERTPLAGSVRTVPFAVPF